jgi:hypothetical protein
VCGVEATSMHLTQNPHSNDKFTTDIAACNKKIRSIPGTFLSNICGAATKVSLRNFMT